MYLLKGGEALISFEFRGISKPWAGTNGRGSQKGGTSWRKQNDKVPAPSHMAAGHCLEM